jgi:hypothetical protein
MTKCGMLRIDFYGFAGLSEKPERYGIMILPNQIADAIEEMLLDKYPKSAIYKNSCPEGFIRPSFCIKTVRAIEWPANRNTVRVRARFCVTAFTVVDGSGKADATNLADIQGNLMSIFRQGYVAVGYRKITVAVKNHGLDSDNCSIDLRFDYFEDRTNETDYRPFMTEVNFQLNKEE